MSASVDLSNKVVLVTGAARGLGAEIVAQMSAAGAVVVGADRRIEAGQAVAEEAGTGFVELDVTSEDDWANAVQHTVTTHGRLDVLVNNAGIIRVSPILESEPDEFRKVVETNLVGAFLGVRSAAPAMITAGGGSIVNISSPAGFEGTPGMAAYASSKWGARGLTRTAALELGEHGIRVNTVVPGPMATAMTRRPGWTDHDYDEFYGATVPLARMGDVAEVAALVCWLASDAASYCTGGDYHADGGLTAGKVRR